LIEVAAVILSVAKHPGWQSLRPFARLRVTGLTVELDVV
jgi:hypothetical protein